MTTCKNVVKCNCAVNDLGETMHPCGLTWERWHWPFKTPAERAIIVAWLETTDLSNEAIPF